MKIESKLKFPSYSVLAFTFIVLLIISMLAIPDEYIDNKNGSNFEALAQTLGTLSPAQLKVLIDNSIQTLQSGDINGTITRLKGAEQEIGTIPKNNENYASVQVVLTLLLADVIKSLDKGDNSEALIYLNLAEQELGRILLYTSNSQNIPPSTFLTYSNHRYKIRINYQYDWIIDGNSYPTGAGGVVLTSFYLPDANVTGLPFFRIGVDNLTMEFSGMPSVSIDQYLKRSLQHKNSTGFPGLKLIKSDTNTSILAGNHAYTIIWTYVHPRYGTRKSIEIATIIGNKGYFVDYTVADAKFNNYLPVVQKMINSFSTVRLAR
jgi:hypothetical protein